MTPEFHDHLRILQLIRVTNLDHSLQKNQRLKYYRFRCRFGRQLFQFSIVDSATFLLQWCQKHMAG